MTRHIRFGNPKANARCSKLAVSKPGVPVFCQSSKPKLSSRSTTADLGQYLRCWRMIEKAVVGEGCSAWVFLLQVCFEDDRGGKLVISNHKFPPPTNPVLASRVPLLGCA